LWADAPPASAVSAIQVHVHHLRRALEPLTGSGIIVTHPGSPSDQVSYTLLTETEAVDVGRFRQLVNAGETAQARGDTSSTVERLDAALDLWRGEPVPELRASPYAVRTRRSLADMRRDAVKRRAAALLELGSVSRATTDLMELHEQHPDDERTVVLLSNALCRADEQTRALRLVTHELDRWQGDYGLRPRILERERDRIVEGPEEP
jgi:DNA-binding SARP family transcriptional activator